MRKFKKLLNWDDHKTALELYISLSGKAAECLFEMDTANVANLDILWTIIENGFLPLNYVTILCYLSLELESLK